MEDRIAQSFLPGATRLPALPLRPFVRRYAGFVERAGTGGLARREVPMGDAPMIVNWGDRLRINAGGGESAEYGSFIAGLHDRHTDTYHDGTLIGIHVDFTPLGASMLLGPSAPDLVNTG